MGEMDVDVLAGSTVPMDRESQIQIMEKLAPLLQLGGIMPGSPASKAFLREYMRLVGIMSLDAVMDMADQQQPSPPPKVMEAQAKVQAKMAETQMKIQGKAQEEEIKLQAMKEKLQIDRSKHELDIQKGIIDSILQQLRQPNGINTVNGDQNGTTL